MKYCADCKQQKEKGKMIPYRLCSRVRASYGKRVPKFFRCTDCSKQRREDERKARAETAKRFPPTGYRFEMPLLRRVKSEPIPIVAIVDADTGEFILKTVEDEEARKIAPRAILGITRPLGSPEVEHEVVEVVPRGEGTPLTWKVRRCTS